MTTDLAHLNRYKIQMPLQRNLFLDKKVCLLGCGESLNEHKIHFENYDQVVGINRLYLTSYSNNINVLYHNMSSKENSNLDKLLFNLSSLPHFRYVVFCPWSSGPARRQIIDALLHKHNITKDQHIYAKGIVRKLPQINKRPLTGIAALYNILLSGAQTIDIYGFDFYTTKYIEGLPRFMGHNGHHDLVSNKAFLHNLILMFPHIIKWHR